MTESLDIICIGESLIELSTDERLVFAQTLNKYYGGDAIVTAVAASRLGSRVGFITRVGNDAFKDFLLDSWAAENIEINYVRLVEGYNGLYIVSRQSDGKKELAFYRKKSAATMLSIDDIQEDYIERASIVYSTGITQSLSQSARDAVNKAFFVAKCKQTLTAYDPNFRSGLWSETEAREAFEEVVDNVDILLLNSKHDGEKLFQQNSPDKLIKTYWDMGVSIVAVKMGDQGSVIGYKGEISHIPSCIGDIVDTTGAGDAYNGGFLHGISAGYTPFEAAKLACIVAAKQIRGLGAIKSVPYKDDVYSEFKRGGEV